MPIVNVYIIAAEVGNGDKPISSLPSLDIITPWTIESTGIEHINPNKFEGATKRRA